MIILYIYSVVFAISVVTGLMSAAPHALSLAVLDPEQSKRLSVSVPAFMHEQVIESPDLPVASLLVNMKAMHV